MLLSSDRDVTSPGRLIVIGLRHLHAKEGHQTSQGGSHPIWSFLHSMAHRNEQWTLIPLYLLPQGKNGQSGPGCLSHAHACSQRFESVETLRYFKALQ